MPEQGRVAGPRALRLVAAGGPTVFDGEIHFHPRLAVLAGAPPGLADWVASLLGPHAPPDTLIEIDDVPARTYDLPRALRALPPVVPLRADMFAELAAGRSAFRTPSQIASALDNWEHALAEARHRLARVHEQALRPDPVELSEAARLRSEWRYAEHVDAWDPTRDTRIAADARRDRYETFLARFGATSYEDLSMVGTGFGDSKADPAIREASMVVSMAEQRCHKLRMELDAATRERTPDDAVDLAALDADHVDRLLARALADLGDTAYVRPLIIDRVLSRLSPGGRRRAYDRLIVHGRRRQIVLVTDNSDVARWAAHEAPSDAALHQCTCSVQAVPFQ
jgi:hypothetical protein